MHLKFSRNLFLYDPSDIICYRYTSLTVNNSDIIYHGGPMSSRTYTWSRCHIVNDLPYYRRRHWRHKW